MVEVRGSSPLGHTIKMKKFWKYLIWAGLGAFLLYFFAAYLPRAFTGDLVPDPILLSLFGLRVRWYGVLIAGGILAAYLVCERELRQERIRPGQVDGIIFWVVLLGLIGARIGFVIQNLGYFRAYPLQMLEIWSGGLSIHGALIGGIIGLVITSRKYKISFLKVANAVSPQVLLATAIGRYGNFFNQEIIGQPASAWIPWKMYVAEVYRPEQFVSNSSFHPVFLYESLLLLALFAFYYLVIKKKYDRDLGFIYAVGGYCLVRILVEFYRADYQPIFLKLDLAQWVSLGLIGAALAAHIILTRRQK